MAWLLLLLLTLGCAHRQAGPALPSRDLEPFSESGDAIPPDRWWIEFNEPGLNQQIELALGENYDLGVALQRLLAARAVVRRESSDLLPDVDGIITGDSTFGPGRDRTRLAVGLDAFYQVDLWGQIRSRVDAERFRAEATRADYYAVALTLSGEIARTWFSLIEAHAQLDLLNGQIETNQLGTTLQEARYAIGQGSAADVWRQRQLLESTYEQAVVVRARIEVLEHLLAVLTGQMPQSATYAPGIRLPPLPPLPHAGVPSELLMRRPDVAAEFLELAAADRDLASAITAQYPRISLTGSTLNLATPETMFRDWFVSIGTQLIAPLIDGGQRRAEVDRTAAVVRQRFNAYGQAMLNAFREVEDNLALERYQIQRIERLKRQFDLAEKSENLLTEEYFLGTETTDFLDVLNARQSQQRLQRETLSARLELVLIRVGLYLSIAGDFDPRPQQYDNPPPEAVNPDIEKLPPPTELAPENNLNE